MLSTGAAEDLHAEPVDSTTVPPWIWPAEGARRESGSIPNADTLAVRSPASALVVTMPSGSAPVIPGTCAHAFHVCSSTLETVNEGSSPAAGAEKTRWSVGRPVMAEVLSFPRPAVRPDTSPTRTVINTMTEPIRAKRPLANRRSFQATNTGSDLPCLGAGWVPGTQARKVRA